jgi:hypothetical protein
MRSHDCHQKTINSQLPGIAVVNDAMKEYLTAGFALIVISLGNFSYVLVKISSYSALTYFIRETVLLWLLQCSASLLCGIFGGYLLAVHTQRQKASSQQLSQDCSVQE